MIQLLFFLFAALAVGSAINVLVQKHVLYSSLSLIVLLTAMSGLFVLLQAEFLAVTNVIVYAGAIMVMYVFVAMMLNLGKATVDQERAWLKPSMWIAPTFMAAPLLIELIWKIRENSAAEMATGTVLAAKQVGIDLFGPYVLAVELASMLLLAGLVGAFHLARK